ncbi:hypothetical protein PN499_01775 [Kamptonema animale CS-326]|nr:hypothetical protein [Kamptonema animale CS-326]
MILVIAFIVIFGEIALASAIKRNQPLTQPPIKITQAFKDIAHNPDFTKDKNVVPVNPDTQEEDAINEFAWRVFIALNWPVDCQGKTLSAIEPPGQKKLIGQAPENPRAWELYPSPKDVFPPDGATPPSLGELPEYNKCVGDGKGSEIEYKPNLRLTEAEILAKIEDFSEVDRENKPNIVTKNGELNNNIISLADIDAVIHIPLVDQQGNYVINEIRMNPVEYEQIRNNKWFASNNLVTFKETEQQLKLVCSSGYKYDGYEKYCSEQNGEGAIEIKAAWRVFDRRSSDQEKAKYYTTKRKIASNTGDLLNEEVELGLIGFHVMHKTSSQGWIWSTFEHIDNAPSCGKPEKTRYTLYNNECNINKENCEQNKPYVKPPYLWYISNDKPKAVTMEESVDNIPLIKDQIPSQICRSNDISESVKKQNDKWHTQLKTVDKSSVWQYYELIGTEWLANPWDSYESERAIKHTTSPLTNVTLEPYVKRVTCIVCHTSARLPGEDNSCQFINAQVNTGQLNAKINTGCADFSFLIDNAKPSQ